MLGKTRLASCRVWDLSPSDFFSWFGRLEPGLRIAFLSQHLRDLATVNEDIGYEAIADILAMRALWKEFSVTPGLVTQQVLLVASPAVPDLPGARVDDEARST
jgi:hypothetical protein